MAVPKLSDFKRFVGRLLTGNDWNFNLAVLINILTDGTSDLTVKSVTATTLGNSSTVYLGDGSSLTGIATSESSNKVFNLIESGKSESDGYPAFLSAGASNDANLLATDINFVSLIDNVNVTVEADISITGLSTAPAANNTALVNNADYSDENFTKVEGEHNDTSIIIDTIGTEISDRDGEIVAFITGTEQFIGKVDVANSKLTDVVRGIGKTDRVTLANNDVLTLHQLNALYLDKDGSTTFSSDVFPKELSTAPSTPATGDIFFNTNTRKFNRFDGASFVEIDAVFLGLAICDTSTCQVVEPADFDVAWSDEIALEGTAIDDTTISINCRTISIAGEVLKGNGNSITIDISDANDRESGVSEAADTRYYVYVDKFYVFRFSDKIPRKVSNRRGHYHPNKYERWTGLWVDNDSVSDFDKFYYSVTGEEQLLINPYITENQIDKTLTFPIKSTVLTTVYQNLGNFEFGVRSNWIKSLLRGKVILRFTPEGVGSGGLTGDFKIEDGSATVIWERTGLTIENPGSFEFQTLESLLDKDGSTTLDLSVKELTHLNDSGNSDEWTFFGRTSANNSITMTNFQFIRIE